MTPENNPRFVYFGTPDLAVRVLEELKKRELLPVLVVTAPDRPQGRGLVLTPSPVKAWAQAQGIPTVEPETLRGNTNALDIIRRAKADLFVVAAYGKILPSDLLAIPAHGTLNVHPSLLPLFRGPSPIESFILSDEKRTGVSIMLLDDEVDHGPIVAQEETPLSEPYPRGSSLTEALGKQGGALLAQVLIPWYRKEITAREQDHARATFTKKIVKEDGKIDLSGDPILNMKKVRAFDDWPGAFTFVERKGKMVRIKIVDALLQNGIFTPTRITPEGKKEMAWDDFLRGC